MMKMIANFPKVSVCVVTYNQQNYIRQCLQSIVDQKTNFDFEVIVADDCSTDGTGEIVRQFAEKYPNKVRSIFHEKNIGASKNFIYVHQQAIGEYVAHMDGDDYALPGKLQAQEIILNSELECTAVWHRVDYFDDFGGFCSGKTADLSLFENGKVKFADAIHLGFISVHSSLMYRRSAREPVSIDQVILDLYITWDLLSKGTGYILPAILGRYRVAASGGVTVSSLQKIRRISIEHAKYFVKKFPMYRKDYFIWALSNLIIDCKNRRLTAINFLLFALRNITIVWPSKVFSNLLNIRKIQVKWNQKSNIGRDR